MLYDPMEIELNRYLAELDTSEHFQTQLNDVVDEARADLLFNEYGQEAEESLFELYRQPESAKRLRTMITIIAAFIITKETYYGDFRVRELVAILSEEDEKQVNHEFAKCIVTPIINKWKEQRIFDDQEHDHHEYYY